MADVLYVGLIVATFASLGGLVRVCARLTDPAADEEGR